MNSKPFFTFALVLCSGLVGCSTTPSAVKTEVVDCSNSDSPAVEESVITDLGKSFFIHESANSWPALIEKAKPAFAWNGCDMMWIERNTKGRPQFVLDEAYIFQPPHQPRQWVLPAGKTNVPYEDLRQESPRFFYSDRNLQATANWCERLPEAADAGGRGDYAVTLGSHRRWGTVYEIGWQREMSVGSSHAQYGRRIYLWKDGDNRWHFLGEGPEEGWARGGGCEVKSKVIWQNAETNNLPFQIQFHREEITCPYNSSADDTNSPPDVTVCYDTALVAEPPAPCQDIGKNPYLLAEKDDTLDKIVYRLGYYFPGLNGWPDAVEQLARNKRALEAWRSVIVQLNPELPQTGIIKEGTRVNLMEPGEMENRLSVVDRQLETLKRTSAR